MKKMYLLPLLGLLLMFGCQDQVEEMSLQDEASKPNAIKANNMNSNGRVILTNENPINKDCQSGTTDLIAGQHNVVGKVVVTIDNDDLIVEYLTDPGCGIGLIHAAIGEIEDDIPQTQNGKAIPGHFEKNISYSPLTNYAKVVFEGLDFSEFDQIVVAAHAEVYCGEESVGVCEEKEMTVEVLERVFDPTYFNFKINDEIVGGWCINFDETMELRMHDVNKIPSTCADMELLSCLFGDNAVNIGAVNWLINQEFEDYEPEDIQMAIWTLMRKTPGNPIPQNTYITLDRGADKEYGGTNDENSDFYPLYEMALKHKDFVPSCGEYVAILLYKDCNTDLDGWQTSIILKKYECGTGSETAWASGKRFVNQGDWGMYATFDLNGCYQ